MTDVRLVGGPLDGGRFPFRGLPAVRLPRDDWLWTYTIVAYDDGEFVAEFGRTDVCSVCGAVERLRIGDRSCWVCGWDPREPWSLTDRLRDIWREKYQSA